MIKLALPFAHRVLGYLKSVNGDQFVLVERTDPPTPGLMPYVTYRTAPRDALEQDKPWLCESGNYMTYLSEAQVDLVKRAGWWS